MARARSAVLLTLLLVWGAAASVAAAAAAKGKGKGKGKGGVPGSRGEECRDLATRGECVARGGGSKCRWCRSEALDDMCFGATEAWRLPPQVFSCDPPPAAANAKR